MTLVLSLGGAERLVVDAAVALKKRGHEITIYTSYYDPNRAFPEIKQQDILVVTKGSFIPRHFGGKGLVVFAILKSWFLGLYLLFRSSFWGLKPDIFLVDQISASIPILKLTGRNV